MLRGIPARFPQGREGRNSTLPVGQFPTPSEIPNRRKNFLLIWDLVCVGLHLRGIRFSQEELPAIWDLVCVGLQLRGIRFSQEGLPAIWDLGRMFFPRSQQLAPFYIEKAPSLEWLGAFSGGL